MGSCVTEVIFHTESNGIWTNMNNIWSTILAVSRAWKYVWNVFASSWFVMFYPVDPEQKQYAWCLKWLVRMVVTPSLVAGKGLPLENFSGKLAKLHLSMNGRDSSQYVPSSLAVHARSTGALMKQFPHLSCKPWALLHWLALCNAIWKNHLKFLYPQ